MIHSVISMAASESEDPLAQAVASDVQQRLFEFRVAEGTELWNEQCETWRRRSMEELVQQIDLIRENFRFTFRFVKFLQATADVDPDTDTVEILLYLTGLYGSRDFFTEFPHVQVPDHTITLREVFEDINHVLCHTIRLIIEGDEEAREIDADIRNKFSDFIFGQLGVDTLA